MPTNKLERIEEALEKLVELYGEKPNQWPEEAKRTCKNLFTEVPAALSEELNDLRDQVSTTFTS